MIAKDPDALERSMRASLAIEGRRALSASTWRWSRGLAGSLPEEFWVHSDAAAEEATTQLGCPAFARGRHIYMGRVAPELREHVLQHEIVHIAQIEHARRTGSVASRAHVEAEAERLARCPVARPVRYGADPRGSHGLWWLPVGIGLYILLRPGVANAPGLNNPIVKSPSMPQIVFESLALFVIPGGAISLAGRLGIGFMGSMAIAGAAGNVSFRGVQDVANGAASSPLLYLFDATTGAVIGFVVPGGFRLIGRAGTFTLDELATWGLVRADIKITERLAQAAAQAPLDALGAQRILDQVGATGQVSNWWLNRRAVMVLYRGQAMQTDAILSPLARGMGGVAASEEMVARMRLFGITDLEMASYTAQLHTQGVARAFLPFHATELIGLPLGGVGIPTTRLPGIAANFGEQGVIYVLRVPRDAAIKAIGWQGLALESEYVILNSVPSGSIVRIIPALEVSPLTVNNQGLLVPGTRVP
jgi:hypothetical protein